MAVERSELRLAWPPGLFAAEARALLAAGADDDALGGLLAEAFHGDRGEKLLAETAARYPLPVLDGSDDDPWSSVATSLHRMAFPRRPTAQLVDGLARDADRLPRYWPRELYSRRQRRMDAEPPLTADQVKSEWAGLVLTLTDLGYLADAFGSACWDNGDRPDEQGQRRLAERLQRADLPLWPMRVVVGDERMRSGFESTWPNEMFLDVVEALDELVARPRRRWWHDDHRSWDYRDYSRTAGQAVYRWQVNVLLAQSQLGLRLATTGEDAGLLVHATGDPRDQLVEQTLVSPHKPDRDDVAHAVRLFRSRTATRQDKRSAVVALAGLLERRRARLKAELLAKDEGALFQIANSFDLRHRDPRQQGDYDEAFLDWIFWWYLATVELTDRLLTGQAGDVSGA